VNFLTPWGLEDSGHASSGELREDFSAEELRALARRSKDVDRSRRLLSLAAIRDGMDQGAAAKIGGMDRQTLRDWVHRFNVSGPDGLIDSWTSGPRPRRSAYQLAEFANMVQNGPNREVDTRLAMDRPQARRERPAIPLRQLSPTASSKPMTPSSKPSARLGECSPPTPSIRRHER
jgi:transposase